MAAWKDGLWVVVWGNSKAGNSVGARADYSAALLAVSTDVQRAVLKAEWRAVSTAVLTAVQWVAVRADWSEPEWGSAA